MKTRAGISSKAFKRGLKRNKKGLNLGNIKQKRSHSSRP